MGTNSIRGAISVKNLSRVYRPRGRPALTALDNVSFDVAPGEILGMLGPNGAGKTTCVRIISTLLLPSSGTVTVAGIDVVADPKRARAACGVSFGGDLGLYTRLSARDNLRYFATMYRLDQAGVDKRVDELLARVDLAERGRDRVENFSRGMRQRLHLARALLHDPPVLLLDEPSAGLDPQAARDLKELVGSLASEGRAILLTTHDLSEAEAVSSRIVILSKGRILRHATALKLREEASRDLGTCVEVVGVEMPTEVLDASPGLISWNQDDERIRIYTRRAGEVTSYLLDRVEEAGGFLQISQPSLEEAYLSLVESAAP